jgi:hypothetical protein
MATSVEYEFRPAFRGDAYEWSPRPPDPAEPWTKLARHALVREWRIQVADAASRAVWTLRWESVNRAGTRGAGLSVSRTQPDDGDGNDPAALALLLEHCRHADGLLALPAGAWHAVRDGGETARAILAATGRPSPQFQLRNLPDDERELLAPLGGLVCLEAGARPIDRSTRTFAAWALQKQPAPDWLQRVVPPDRSRALRAFLVKPSPLPGLLNRLRQLDESTIRGVVEVERAASDLRKLADLAGAGGVRLRLVVQPPDGSFGLRLGQGEVHLPIDQEKSARIAASLGLDPPVSPPRPEPRAAGAHRETASVAPLSLKPKWPWRELAIGMAAVGGAFLLGRITAPTRAQRTARAPVVNVPVSTTTAPVKTPPARGKPSPAVLDRAVAPSLRLTLAEVATPAGPDLAEPTCTPNGDVLRTEPDRLVIVPCGVRQPREAYCVAGACRQAGELDEELPETACGRDGAALVLDRDQKVFRPASPPTFTCPAAWYGVPGAGDPMITSTEAVSKPRPRPASPTPAAFKQSIRSWAKVIRSNPRTLYTVVGYGSGAPKETCARLEARVRAALTRVTDALVAEQAALKAQLVRPPALRTCAAPPGVAADPATAANHLFLVRGFVPGCSCSEIRPNPRPSAR